MSTSRLEKFIYAICSMEVSDLPAPISRIEILWNCLITGETPDFEPQSRNEQYLMAMLGLYELENLPAPMSRGEKLLYKIAMGETDLSDVPGYLSRYEELLGYLAENGGVGDFEYILQTLNQRLSTLYSTKERPVKSAILSGSTKYQIGEFIQDVYAPVQQFKTGYYLNYSDGTLVKGNSDHKYCEDFISIPTGVTSITSKGNNNWKKLCCYDSNKNYVSGVNGTSDSKDLTLNIPSNAKYFRYSANISQQPDQPEEANEYIDIVSNTGLLLASSNYNIPCELISCKMPVLTTVGKNLFDGEMEIGGIDDYGMSTTSSSQNRSKNYIEVEANTNYSLSRLGTVAFDIFYYDENKNFIEKTTWLENKKTPVNCKYVKFASRSLIETDIQIQFELSVTKTTYEPHKTNILTVNGDVTLRGIGDVRDELDLLTGEVTERIGEIVLDETLDYRGSSSANGENTMYFQFDLGAYPSSTPISHYFKVSSANLYVSDNDYEAIRITSSGALQLRILKSKLPTTDTDGVKEFFKQNNISIQYQLAQESIKTVDLITVDQDGQPTQLKTFNDITHVELSSEGLIPEVELEVATKINETLLTMSPQHHDISETQNKLGQTIDEQTENTDAAMLATTEIYEQTL